MCGFRLKTSVVAPAAAPSCHPGEPAPGSLKHAHNQFPSRSIKHHLPSQGHPAKARARASLAFVLALMPKTYATTRQRWCPKLQEPCRAETEPVPVPTSPFRPADESFVDAHQKSRFPMSSIRCDVPKATSP